MKGLDQLTERQREVCVLFLSGWSEEQIGAELGLSARQQGRAVTLRVLGYSISEVARRMEIKYGTAKKHLECVYDRLGVRTKHELVQKCVGPIRRDYQSSS